MQRRAIFVRGTVQGVGFRPFVYGLAARLQLAGFVRNQTDGVYIEVEGPPPQLDRFLDELAAHPPPLAQIDGLRWDAQPPRGGDQFRIEHSEASATGPIVISPDVATCDDCLAELTNPADRRYGYPFLNCTNCGPRLTIIQSAPYDRQRTTMAGFPMCPACQAEYDNPRDRRFHAQPTACPACGPKLQLVDAAGQAINTPDPLAFFARALLAGKIGALKGLGGYHLVCDARNAGAVAELRRRKHRDEKPFAIMIAEVGDVASLCAVNAAERELLTCSRRPIVLLRKRQPCPVADEMAPGNPYLGVMLPYTPLHHLLFSAMKAQQANPPLVMTSGNRSDEPIAYEDPEALEKLAEIADLFLMHNRPIHVRCDDSVTRVVGGLELPIRRSRGYAPQPIALPLQCPAPILAVGGQLKGTFALGRERQAVVSHHLGDLDHVEAFVAFERDITLYEQLFAAQPECIVHDLHPDYASTHYARKRAAAEGVKLLAVQHHHAHMASCMAEHGLDEPVIGVSFDGTGYGTDGTIWGGEFLVGDYAQFRRAAHLRYVGLPGGDHAIREPWRIAAAHLVDAGCACPSLESRIAPMDLATIRVMIERKFNTPLTSSAGRLFDAVASLAGVRDRVGHEGQAAMQLEWLASTSSARGHYPFEIAADPAAAATIDTRPLIRAVCEDVAGGVEPATIARRFHSTAVEFIVAICQRLREQTGINAVVFSGGVFLNALLTEETAVRLAAEDFRVHRHRRVPPNDGGISLGQIAVAARRLQLRQW